MAKRKVKKFTEDEINTITDMYSSGHTYADISRVIKKDPSTIRNKLIHIGIGKVNKKYNKGYAYAIGDHVKDCEVLEHIRIKTKNAYLKGYKLKCLVYGEVFEYTENCLQNKQTKGSPFKSGHRLCDGNMLINKSHVLPYLKDKDDAKRYTYRSSEKVNCVCPSCGLSRTAVIRDLVFKGFFCRVCDKNIKIPERTFSSMCVYSDVEIEPQKTFEGFKTDKGKYYFFDFYIKEINTCVELMGEQHYHLSEGSLWGDVESIRKRDKIKKEFCNKNNINYVAIDCKKSDYNYIIDNVLNSEIGYLFNDVNRELVVINSLKNRHNTDVESLINDFTKGMSYKDLMVKYNKKRHTIVRILQRSGNYNKRTSDKKVLCITTGETFNSLTIAGETYNTPSCNISKSCKSPSNRKTSAGKHPITGEKLYWEYVDKE